MFSIRNVGGVSLFLFGTTFIWLTPMFATEGRTRTGVAWSLTNALSLVTIVIFTVATWGLFQRESWWEIAALAGAAVGVAALIPYWTAASHAGETAPAFNVLIHAAGSAGVFLLLLLPVLEKWVDRHVMS